MKKNLTQIFILILLITSYIFLNIKLEINNNIEMSIGLITYSLIYLLSSKLINKQKIRECKIDIFTISILFILFFLIISLLSSINIKTTTIIPIRNVFTPNSISINNIKIFYPNLLNLILFPIIFYFSQYIFFVTTEVLDNYTNHFINFLTSILISFILNQIFYVTLTNIISLITNNITINIFLKELTNNFFVVLTSSIILTIISLLLNIKKNKIHQ